VNFSIVAVQRGGRDSQAYNKSLLVKHISRFLRGRWRKKLAPSWPAGGARDRKDGRNGRVDWERRNGEGTRRKFLAAGAGLPLLRLAADAARPSATQIEANIPGKGYARVGLKGDMIAEVTILGPERPGEVYIGPGLIDIQLNGFAGVNFSDPDLRPEQLISLMPKIWTTGVTSFCPTLITNSFEGLERNFRVFEEARRIDVRLARAIPCYHLEGPYISKKAKGTHNERFLRDPDWTEFSKWQEAAGGRIGILTLAPELPGAIEMIRKARQAGITVAIGHTDASPEQVHMAADAGAQMNTHLGNGNPQMIHRHRAPFWAQLDDDRLLAGMICDTFHLPPEVVRIVYRVKGIERCVLVTDAVHVTGLPPGPYVLVGVNIELLPSGQVVMADRTSLAGSALTMNRAVSVFSRFAGVTLQQALQAATANPARILPRGSVCAELTTGQLANLVLFRPGPDALRIDSVYLCGENVVSPC
jgi:N-acetylglucosamine-6-phosphate deacetylase